jgi:hypothetical protein
MSKDLNEIRALAGLPPVKESTKLDESVVGGMNSVEDMTTKSTDTEMEKWLKIVSESETESLNEHVVGDLNNGYDRQHKTSKYHSDYFPTGATSNVVDDAGPASSDQGDNPMQKAGEIEYRDEVVESKEIHKELVYEYRKFISE